MKTTVTIPTTIGKVCAKEDGRYALTGVKISPHKDPKLAWLTAVDGRVIACLPTDVTGDRNPPDYIPQAVLPTTRKGAIVTRNSRWENNKGKSTDLDPEAGQFPCCDQVIPDLAAEGAYSISLNAKLLLALAQALGSDKVTLIIHPRNDGQRTRAQKKAIRVLPVAHENDEDSGGFGIIMPMNTTEGAFHRYINRANRYRADWPKTTE